MHCLEAVWADLDAKTVQKFCPQFTKRLEAGEGQLN